MSHTPLLAPLLDVKNLHISFADNATGGGAAGGGWREVVHDLNFSLSRGETLAIVGESGSGKSVTALSLLRLLPKNATKISGSLLYQGHDLLAHSDKEMRSLRGHEIAMIFQEPMTSLNPVMTIGEQISEVLMAHQNMSKAAAKQEAIRLMERVRIPSAQARYGDYTHQFSGGMRQRIMIAIALAGKPKILIADEPTTALDVTIQAQVLALIKQLQQEENMAVLFITHDMGVVAEIADRTLVMLRGQQIETGTTSEIFHHSQHPYTQSLLAAVPRLGSMAAMSKPEFLPLYDYETGKIITKPSNKANSPVFGTHVFAAASTQAEAQKQADEKLIKVKNLSMYFAVRTAFLKRVAARVHAVENVSFELNHGETLAIVGESGSGKSTTGRLLTGLLTPTKGEIFIKGKKVGVKRDKELSRQIQMIFQDPFASLNPRLTIGQALAEPLRIHRLASPRQARDIALSLLSQVGLPTDILSRKPHEFSGGQRQRICIARALALNPAAIVADEAVSALDVSVKAQIINLLLELQQQMALGFVFISHDMAIVERIAHRVAVMYLGQIVEIGSRAAIFANPSHPYTQKLLEAVPVPDPQRRRHMLDLENLPELQSPVKPRDHVVEAQEYRQIAPDHYVMGI